jgi:hypothetical protein
VYQLTKFSVVILTGVALLCWAAPTLAGPTVPYKDHASGQAVVTGGTFPTFAVHIHGFGEGTHLGHFEFDADEILQFDVQDPATGEILEGVGTNTAADGSTAKYIYFGTFTTLPDGTGTLRLDLTVLILEGTGRLEGVTGEYETIVLVPPTFSFTETSKGTLMFPDRP